MSDRLASIERFHLFAAGNMKRNVDERISAWFSRGIEIHRCVSSIINGGNVELFHGAVVRIAMDVVETVRLRTGAERLLSEYRFKDGNGRTKIADIVALDAGGSPRAVVDVKTVAAYTLTGRHRTQAKRNAVRQVREYSELLRAAPYICNVIIHGRGVEEAEVVFSAVDASEGQRQ